MANDTPTVEQARDALIEAIHRYVQGQDENVPLTFQTVVSPAIDALIAAVRAETAPTVDDGYEPCTCLLCRR